MSDKSVKTEPRKRHHKKTFPTISGLVAIIVILALMVQITVITPAHALTRYYNCIARVANKNATLSISNVDACYNLIFKGALDYYGIKQPPVSPDKSTGPQENPNNDSVKKQTYNNVQDRVHEDRVHDSLQTRDVFG